MSILGLMEDKDWFWQDDSYKLDAESPLAISRSLWDGLAQSEADSRSLFATTPSAEIIDSNLVVSSFSRRDVDAGSSIYDASNSLQEGSPPSKRRRMLLFPGATEESAISDPSFNGSLESSYERQCAPMIPSCDDLDNYDVAVPSSPTSLWYMKHEDPQYTLSEVLDPQKWMVRDFGDAPGNDPCDPKSLTIPISDNSGSCSYHQQPSPCESDVTDWPSTPLARTPTPGTRPGSALNGRPKSVTPVAYPFALLKPCGAQGDVTLNDINQRISMRPSRPSSQPHLGGDDSRHSPSQSSPSPTGGSPSRSGKSVVGLAKIHTEGNGTITIVRTRG